MMKGSNFDNPTIDDMSRWFYGWLVEMHQKYIVFPKSNVTSHCEKTSDNKNSMNNIIIWKNYNNCNRESLKDIRDNMRKKLRTYFEDMLKDPENYEKDLAKVIREGPFCKNYREHVNHCRKLDFLTNLEYIYMKEFPNKAVPLIEQFQDICCMNNKNILEILNIMHDRGWFFKWDEDNIFDENFRKICTTPILLPFASYPISGEYLIYILHKDKIKFYYSDTSYSSQYMRFYKSYMGDFEKYLSLSLNNLFEAKDREYVTQKFLKKLEQGEKIPEESYGQYLQKNRIGTKAESFFEELDYVSYVISDGKEGKKKKYNFLSMFEDSRTHELFPYVNPCVNAIFHGKFEVHPAHQARFVFKTLLLQNIGSENRARIHNMVGRVNVAILAILMVLGTVQQYVACLITAKRTAPTREAMEKYAKLLSDYECYVKEKFYRWKKNVRELESKRTCQKVEVDKDNLYETVLWKLYVQEFTALITGIEQACRISFQPHDKADAFFDYLHLAPDECIEVRTWSAFKEKYGMYLMDFFPNLSEDDLEKLWYQTVTLMLCLFPSQYSIELEQKRLPRPQNPVSEKWLKRNQINIENMRTREFFSFMHLIFFSSSWEVTTKGSNTFFYYAPQKKDEETGKSENKVSLKTALTNVKTHFTSKYSPHYADVLILQVSLWVKEQHFAFFMTKSWLDLFREFLLLYLNMCKSNILQSDSIEKCMNHAWGVATSCPKIEESFLANLKNLSKEDPFFRDILKAAKVPVDKKRSTDKITSDGSHP